MRCSFCLTLFALSGVAAAARGDGPDDLLVVTLDTGVVSRTLSLGGMRLQTSLLGNEISGAAIRTDGDEFRLRLVDGTELTTEDYVATLSQPKTNEQWGFGRPRVSQALVTLLPRDGRHPKLTVEYTAQPGDHFIRKRIVVQPAVGAGPIAVDWLAVESLEVQCGGEHGGFGQPVFLDRAWFAGLEHPAGYNTLRGGVLSCLHHPGRAEFTSPWAVLGGLGTQETAIEEEFLRYLGTLRPAPRPMLQYNTWYDVRGPELSPAALESTFALLDQKLLKPFGLRLDALVIDDGWQNRPSLWQPGASWPEGFAPLASRLESRDAGLGLWLPLNGFGLDTSHLAKEGFPLTDQEDDYFCLACRSYRDKLRGVLEQHLRDGRLAYVKHDFNFLHCGAAGHDHLATSRHGLEANVDAQIELLAHERRLRPDVFLNVTSNLWPSPWWLAHADAIWMGGPDLDHVWHAPQRTTREAEMTSRDQWLHRLLRVERTPLPIDRLMTHGIIRGRHGGEHAAETLREWSDYVVFTLGRGTLLREMYISPERMPDDHWSVLGHALRWADANTQVFRRTQMIGGRPDQGEAYGFLHRSDGKMIACLRNPSPLPSRLAIDLVGQPRRTGGSPVRAGEPQAPHAAWQPIIVYPSRQKLAGVAEHSSLEVDLPGSSVVVVELYRDLPTSLRSLPPGYFDAIASAAGTRLVEYEPPRFAPIGPREPPRFDRKNYAATYELGASANRVDAGLSLVRYPAGGARLSLLSDAETRPPQTIAPKHGAWDLASYTLPADASRLELAISLPPSPFWPQRSTACVVWHETQKLAIRKETELSAAEDQPAWPMIVQPGAITRDVVLIDHQPFYRRRSAGESLAWVFLLGVTPVSACGALVWRRTAQRSFWQRCACATLALAALAALYACTPIAAALGRALSG